jgi:hypothetical protein
MRRLPVLMLATAALLYTAPALAFGEENGRS